MNAFITKKRIAAIILLLIILGIAIFFIIIRNIQNDVPSSSGSTLTEEDLRVLVEESQRALNHLKEDSPLIPLISAYFQLPFDMSIPLCDSYAGVTIEIPGDDTRYLLNRYRRYHHERSHLDSHLALFNVDTNTIMRLKGLPEFELGENHELSIEGFYEDDSVLVAVSTGDIYSQDVTTEFWKYDFEAQKGILVSEDDKDELVFGIKQKDSLDAGHSLLPFIYPHHNWFTVVDSDTTWAVIKVNEEVDIYSINKADVYVKILSASAGGQYHGRGPSCSTLNNDDEYHQPEVVIDYTERTITVGDQTKPRMFSENPYEQGLFRVGCASCTHNIVINDFRVKNLSQWRNVQHVLVYVW